MVTHVVLFRMKDPKRASAEAFRDKLLAMEGRIEGLESIEVGLDESGEDRASDLSLITRHSSWDALKSYHTHPVHLEVVAFGKTVIESSTVVDYSGDALKQI